MPGRREFLVGQSTLQILEGFFRGFQKQFHIFSVCVFKALNFLLAKTERGYLGKGLYDRLLTLFFDLVLVKGEFELVLRMEQATLMNRVRPTQGLGDPGFPIGHQDFRRRGEPFSDAF